MNLLDTEVNGKWRRGKYFGEGSGVSKLLVDCEPAITYSCRTVELVLLVLVFVIWYCSSGAMDHIIA